ncbi:DUF4440 domain-containing protein [Nonomuraea soli]|uniref:DUF4440 domain-containing protein n=1 Tax=Nonomuraea soli TaxID=1032476 RepID=A0A7W0HSP5_9ACTN|nr:DUF4440 domain-containing protein [Nonomuraea soli]MBA2894220.1 hypothetical protein [Nonomuraea soli]
MNDRDACEAEIVAHHEVIEGWLRGTVDDFALFERAQAAGFTLNEPGGARLDRGRVMEWVEGARGSAPDLKITIVDVRLVAAGETHVVADYIERQPTGDRRATVVFVRDREARHGLRWLHLHETWTHD